jgi:transposase-like protein
MSGAKRDNGVLYSCHEDNEKKRCPECRSLETKKKGFIYSNILSTRGIQKRKTQRYCCKKCSKNFTFHGHNVRNHASSDLKKRAVFDYVATKNSLSEVGARYGISKSTILNWLPIVSESYPPLPSLNCELKASGIIQLDGKVIKIKGKKKTLLIASDAEDKKPFYYLFADAENTYWSTQFLQKVKALYPVEVKGVISDFGRGRCFLAPIKEIFPSAPHQICLVHYLRYVWLFLPRTRRSQFFWRNKVLKGIIKKIIKAENSEESCRWMEKLISLKPFFRAAYHKRFINSVIRHHGYLTRYHEHPFLKTNTNVSENINRQFERKLKNMDGFKSESNLDAFLKIWFACFRMKKH